MSVLFCCCKANGILAPQPTPAALEGEVFSIRTTGPPGKSQELYLKYLMIVKAQVPANQMAAIITDLAR